MRIYTGVGSRKTPKAITNLMTELARTLGDSGWCLRSGGADGADVAFESGASTKEIYVPPTLFNDCTKSFPRRNR
jgi:predicted Rossmann fold nucleotide-binding protein DprA/Smf involved in DNA uptake